MKKIVISLISILAFALVNLPTEINAQGRSQERPGRSGDAPRQNKNATGVPIDGGASVLLAAGAAYGLKRLIDYRNQNRKKEQ